MLKTVNSSVRLLRISPRKLNLVANSIKNLTPNDAIKQMMFSKKKASKYILAALKTAVANAENNHNLRISSLIISNASVGKARCMKRFRARARGRSASIHKFFSNLYISLSITEQLDKNKKE